MSVTAVPVPPEPDPHGQAALLLVESLIHGLVGRRVLSLQEAVDVIEVALDAQIGLEDIDRSIAPATDLLQALLRSLEIDLPRP
jgi:hypothetical protein